MELKIINQGEVPSGEMYNSDECRQVFEIYSEYYPKIGFNLPWVGYFVISQNHVLGTCGFTGKPSDGKVEIAYYTFKRFEGQGVASFSCKELISIARQNYPDIIVTAKTAPEYNFSVKILQKNNFRHSGLIQDEEIGDAWLWVLEP